MQNLKNTNTVTVEGTITSLRTVENAIFITLAQRGTSDNGHVSAPYFPAVIRGKTLQNFLNQGFKKGSVIKAKGLLNQGKELTLLLLSVEEVDVQGRDFHQDAKGNQILIGGLNEVHIVGNLGADPRTNPMADGSSASNFRVALNDSYKGQDRTTWVDVSAFREVSKQCESLTRGNLTEVKGVLATRSREVDGVTRSELFVKAEEVTLKHKRA